MKPTVISFVFAIVTLTVGVEALQLDGPYDRNNPFARTLRGELSAVKVYEDSDVLAFMPLRMQSLGHVLVISKTSRARTIIDIEPEELTKVMAVVQRVAVAQYEAFNPAGIRVFSNSGAAAGQSVFHLHVHVLPVYANAAATTGDSPTPTQELERVAALLRRRMH